MNNQQTVFVGLSGGVDSSVAALRLKSQGYKVVGVFIKVWHPEFMICNWEQERLDAMRVAAHLEIPFLTCDAEADYRDEVAKYFIEEYKAGRTPNPDVMCNKHVKFGAFLRFAKNKGADFIATGHYAQKNVTNEQNELHRGKDDNKDQTYFLWTLSKEELDYSLFPVGDTSKSDIRREATQAKVPTATKADSQGICFLGHVDIYDFLSHYVELKEGEVLDESNSVIGKHKGALVYTIGQRHGFSITDVNSERKPMYVIDRNIAKNTILVSPEKPMVMKNTEVILNNIILRSGLESGEVIEAQFRYRQKPFKVEIISIDRGIIKLKPQEGIDQGAVGQSCVLYRGRHCIGGGTIS